MLARLILAWFVLTLGVAVASPMVYPQAMELVCSDGGTMKVVVIGEDGEAVQVGQHTLDCPMCLAAVLPPAFVSIPFPHLAPLLLAQHPFAAAHIAALVGAPLPPRGPPSFS